MKKLLFTLFLFASISSVKATVHEILVWEGYYQFTPGQLNIMLGDTIEWSPLDFPSMMHTITSDGIPLGATEFDYIYQAPADTFFQYIPEYAGVYNYVCTPHISNGMVASFTVIDPLSVDELDSFDFTLFPNPCKKSEGLKLDIEHLDNFAELTLILISIDGKIVRQQEINDLKNTIPVNDLVAGVYLVRINEKESTLKTSKLILVDE